MYDIFNLLDPSLTYFGGLNSGVFSLILKLSNVGVLLIDVSKLFQREIVDGTNDFA
jgi:hypothetical protein